MATSHRRKSVPRSERLQSEWSARRTVLKEAALHAGIMDLYPEACYRK